MTVLSARVTRSSMKTGMRRSGLTAVKSSLPWNGMIGSIR